MRQWLCTISDPVHHIFVTLCHGYFCVHTGLEAFSADNLEAFGEMDFSDASSTGSQDMDYNESDESDLDAGVEGLNMGAEDIKHILPDEDHDTGAYPCCQWKSLHPSCYKDGCRCGNEADELFSSSRD